MNPVYPDGSTTPDSPHKPWSARYNAAPTPIGDMLDERHESPWFQGYEDEYEALMRCAPHEDPHMSSSSPLGEAAVAALEGLDPLEQFIVYSHVIGGFSFRQMGDALGIPKSTVHSVFKRSLDELREAIT